MLEDLKIPVKQTSCRVRTVAAEMSEKDAEILESAVMNPDWPFKTLEVELYRKGVNLSEKAIKRHREKHCSCWKI
jgi:hypothetical protein